VSGRTTATLGIDVGTTETKAGIVSLDGRLLGLARRRHGGTVDPDSGLAEQDAEDWWAGLVATVREAGQAARVATSGRVDVIGLAVDGHGPTLLAVDAAGVPVRPAITWQDTRSSEDAQVLEARTGLRGWALGILPAARWLERHEPDAARSTRWYLNSWEALALRLTGRAAAVAAGAAGPLPDDVLSACGISPDRLPP